MTNRASAWEHNNPAKAEKDIFVHWVRSFSLLTVWISMCWEVCLTSWGNKQWRSFSKIHRNWEKFIIKHQSQMTWYSSHCFWWSCPKRCGYWMILFHEPQTTPDPHAAACLEAECTVWRSSRPSVCHMDRVIWGFVGKIKCTRNCRC